MIVSSHFSLDVFYGHTGRFSHLFHSAIPFIPPIFSLVIQPLLTDLVLDLQNKKNSTQILFDTFTTYNGLSPQ